MWIVTVTHKIDGTALLWDVTSVTDDPEQLLRDALAAKAVGIVTERWDSEVTA